MLCKLLQDFCAFHGISMALIARDVSSSEGITTPNTAGTEGGRVCFKESNLKCFGH